MIRRNRIFFYSFLGAASFALTLLLFVYLTIPDASGVGLTAMDIATLMIGNTTKVALSLITLSLLCALAAMVLSRVLIGHEHQQLVLRKQLFSTYATLQETQDELRQLKETLTHSTLLARDMREKLKRLERGAPSVLTNTEYELPNAPRKETLITRTLESVTDELSQASDAMREVMPSTQSLEHTLAPLHSRADAAGKALAMLDGLIQRLNRLVMNATIEAARLGHHGESMIRLLDEFKLLARDTAEHACAIGEQMWHVKETLATTQAPLLALRDDALSTLRHLTEATELLDTQWERLTAPTEAVKDPAITRAVAEAAKQAELLEKRMQSLVEPKRNAA